MIAEYPVRDIYGALCRTLVPGLNRGPPPTTDSIVIATQRFSENKPWNFYSCLSKPERAKSRALCEPVHYHRVPRGEQEPGHQALGLRIQVNQIHGKGTSAKLKE